MTITQKLRLKALEANRETKDQQERMRNAAIICRMNRHELVKLLHAIEC